MRRFEHPSGKFWTIAIRSPVVTVRWGQIGTPGQRRDLTIFGLETPAAKARELIAKQLALGYVEVMDTAALVASIVEGKRWWRRFEGDGEYVALAVDRGRLFEWRGELAEVAPAPVQLTKLANFTEAKSRAEHLITAAVARGMVATQASEPEDEHTATRIVISTNVPLEAECRAAPDDPEPWAVYADWLMQNNDPRGEIAALRVQGKEHEADAKLVTHRAELFDDGEATDDDDEFCAAISLTSWRHGFATGATIKPEDESPLELDQITRRFLALPIAAFIDELRFGLAGFESNNDWTATMTAVCESGRDIRILRFDEFDSNEQEISWTAFGDFSAAWARLPQLEELSITSGEGGTLGTIALPKLRKFKRESGGLRASELLSIANARWPELEHLELWFGQARYGAEGNASLLVPIFEARGLPNLRHLGLVNCEFSESAIQHLIGSKLLRQLVRLDFEHGIIANREADLLVANAASFRHLAAIDVTHNYLLPSDLSRLREALPNVVSRNQRVLDDPDDDEEDNRYAAIGE